MCCYFSSVKDFLNQFGRDDSNLRLGVIGLTLRAILSQVPDITFLECFLCDRYHLYMTLGVGSIDQNC